MAPEIILAKKNIGYKGFPVDIWSSGIVLYIILAGEIPFKKSKSNKIIEEDINKELEYLIIKEEFKKIENISEDANNLLKGLLCKDPKKRLTCDEILIHPWLNDNKQKKEHITYQLFTENEIIMLSKAYIDYRKDKNENLKEYFNISNLYDENNIINEDIKNEKTKSIILTPFNSMISSEDDLNKNKNISFKNIKIENDILEIGSKVKDHYRLYELNNNYEIDNGIMIYTQKNTNSISYSNISKDNTLKNNNFDNDNGITKLEDNEKKDEKDNNKANKVLNQLEEFGYSKKYVIKCIIDKDLNYAVASYYLMINYDI